MNKLLVVLLIFVCFQVSAHEKDSTMALLARYVQAVDNFTQYFPQEKVYLHFDNTSYYQGDHIWFKCYVTAPGLHYATLLSKTLYVELLNPGGEIIDKQILKIENGQCHGDFALNRLPFYSGFFEVRAYTKYMLNFGEEAIFSRLLPVFNKPRTEGNFEEKDMQRYGTSKYPAKRKKPQKGKKVNLKFYPEGGNLVQGVTSQVAFEATDAFGNPIDIDGAVIDENKEEVARFSVLHDGRGIFAYTPPAGDPQKAIITHNEKNYKFELPSALPEGIVMQVDNTSYVDSIGISLQKSENIPPCKLGMAVINGGSPYQFCIVSMASRHAVRFKIDQSELPTGVSRIVLFDQKGKILCDRLVFCNRGEFLNIQAEAEKEMYAPHERIDMNLSVTGKNGQPAQIPFSLSVKDGNNEVEASENILTHFLLMSEIKGYVHRPSYYFESDETVRKAALDQLLMVQGWRRYSWEKMAGIEPFDLKYKAEQGIETTGRVVSFVKGKPKPNIDISFFLLKRGEEEKEAGSFVGTSVTDSLGRFSFASDVSGKWNLILSVMEKGKHKDYRILLDRLFSPSPRQYQLADMQVSIAGSGEQEIAGEDSSGLKETDIEPPFPLFPDSLNDKKGMQEKIHRLDEVVVTAKKRTRERDIYTSRSKSIAYYDVHSEMDDIKDEGKYIGSDIHELMINMNNNFRHSYVNQGDYLQYKGRMPLFVINYEPTMATEMDYNKYKVIRLEAIKSIYISEDISTMCKYADPRISPFDIDKLYGCVVFVETYPEGEIPTDAAKGVRKTGLQGYSQTKEFYSPDYSTLPPEPDYRRTLYWNPNVVPDTTGKAKVQFYNNSNCRKLSISAETISPEGIIGVYKENNEPTL